MLHIPDTAWKFGCGRYLQGADALEHLKEEIDRLGGKPFVIAGPHAWQAVLDAEPALSALQGWQLSALRRPVPPSPSREAGTRRSADVSVLVGVGGGRIMDLTKLAGQLAHKPVINVPTVTATCAACTPLSVMYTEEGRTVGTWFHPTEVDAVIADTRVLAVQPVRYASSGILDSLAKACEIAHHGARALEKPDMRAASFMAEYLFDRLMAIYEKAIADIERRELTAEVDELAFLTLAVTGMISGTARGSLQSAIGHAVYEEARKQFPRETACALHGEIVGVGLIYQTRYTGVRQAEMQRVFGKTARAGQP